MSASSIRRINERCGGGSKITAVPSTKPSRSTTPVPERFICQNSDPVKTSTGKENANNGRPTSRIRAAATSQKPAVPPIARVDKDSMEPRARWSTNFSMRPKGRSSSPSEFNRVISDVRKTRVSVDRNQRSVSVDRSTRAVQQNKGTHKDSYAKSNEFDGDGVTIPEDSKNSEVRLENSSEHCKELKLKHLETQNARVNVGVPDCSRKEDMMSRSKSLNTQSNFDSAGKVSESVKLFEKFKSKSWVALRSTDINEKKENGVQLSLKESNGKPLNSSDSLKEKGACEDGLVGLSNGKYPSKLHGKLAFLEEKVKKIASDIKRTKEMLDSNNPDASKVMLSDIQETVAGIEKAMCHVVKGEKENMSAVKTNESDNLLATIVKTSPIKDPIDVKSSAKGLNIEELEARFFPHHKLIRDRTTLKASSGSHQIDESKVAASTTIAKQEKSSIPINASLIAHEFLASLRDENDSSEISEVQEMDINVNSIARDSSNLYSGKGNVETMLKANEILDECDEEDNVPVMTFDDDMEDSNNNPLNEIGTRNSTGGWFVSEGESVLLAHDDGSCSFYDVANSEEKSIYKAPAEVSPNLWRDCWILRAPGADGCSGKYVVAASAGNSMDSGFCSWDFYTKQVQAIHIEGGVANTRTALAPLPNNLLNRRHDLSTMIPENRQWWYRPCGPLIISTASCQKVVRIYDIRDGEHIMKWEVRNPVIAMDNSSPLQWRNRGKVVVAEAETVSLWDVGSLNPQPLISVSSSGRKISALHVNNTDAELGGGVRQRVSSGEAEGNDGVLCTSDSINVLDFRNPSGIGLKIPKVGTSSVHSVFSRGDSIYIGCSSSVSGVKKQDLSCGYEIQQLSLRKQKLLNSYVMPESNAHAHYKAITQVWGNNSNLVMGVCGMGLFVFDDLKEQDLHGSGQKMKDKIGSDDLYSPSFDYLGSRVLLISRDRPAMWRYLT